MIFCTNCGASMEGQFCAKCGAKAGAEASTPPAASMPAASPEPAGPPRKKRKLLIWALAGCGGLLVLALIGIVVFGLFIRNAVYQYGGNPGFAAAKMIASMNPNIEVVNADEATGRITLRERSTGRTVTLDFREIQKGRISFEPGAGEKVDIQTGAEGEPGSVRLQGSEGTMEWGAGSLADVPAWVPRCPGAVMAGSFTSLGKGQEGGSLQIRCDGPVQKVADYYEQALKGAGMKVERYAMPGGGTPAVTVTGAAPSGRTITAAVASAVDGTVATIVYGSKE